MFYWHTNQSAERKESGYTKWVRIAKTPDINPCKKNSITITSVKNNNSYGYRLQHQNDVLICSRKSRKNTN